MESVLSLASVGYIKEALLKIIFNNEEHTLFENIDLDLDKELNKTFSTIRVDLNFPTKNSANCFRDFKQNNKKFNYYYRLLINLANRASVMDIHNTDSATWLGLINNEFNRVNCLIALVAWLTIDDWRWHKEYGQYDIPEDLQYGLVLQEPTAVITFALYILGYKRDLDNETVSQIKTSLKDYLSTK